MKSESDDESVLPFSTSSLLEPPAQAGGTGLFGLGRNMAFAV
jgi:hypothetical protein